MSRRLNLGSKLLAAVLVIGLLLVSFPPDDDATAGWLRKIVIWFVAYGLVTILAIIEASLLVARGDLVALRHNTLLVKLAGLPLLAVIALYIWVIVAGGMLFASMMAVGGVIAIATLAMLPFMIGAIYLVMLPTSIYGVASLIQLRREGAIGWPFFIVQLLLHLLLVGDIVSSLIVAVRAQYGRIRASRLVGWLALAVALVIFGSFAPVLGNAVVEEVDQRRQEHIAKMPGVVRMTSQFVELSPSVTIDQARSVYRELADLRTGQTQWDLQCRRGSLTVRRDDPDQIAGALVVLCRADVGRVTTMLVDIDDGPGVAAGSVRVGVTTEDLFSDSIATLQAVADAEPATRRAFTMIRLQGPDSDDWTFQGTTWIRSADALRLVQRLSRLRTDDATVRTIDLESGRSTIELAAETSHAATTVCRAGNKAVAGHSGIVLTVSVKGARPKPCP
ncbi:hypothetical protein [Microlunatus soli]|uniref:Uncharacterized protein n=1 Tax=Microlunatus soli TaxID=630515 RepID=A0A1H1ZY02_9ACTN|nr:hypothetical protein [Microlunatus soli]SDT38126.1 hypothetical protein SAMN04489812_5508 [Microlunatus soli]